jgi:hypothetical protein
VASLSLAKSLASTRNKTEQRMKIMSVYAPIADFIQSPVAPNLSRPFKYMSQRVEDHKVMKRQKAQIAYLRSLGPETLEDIGIDYDRLTLPSPSIAELHPRVAHSVVCVAMLRKRSA